MVHECKSEDLTAHRHWPRKTTKGVHSRLPLMANEMQTSSALEGGQIVETRERPWVLPWPIICHAPSFDLLPRAC